jgi:predicted Zn-dependent protease
MTQKAVAAVNGALGGMDPSSRERLIGLLAAGAGVRGLAYDRQQESEADHIGLIYMARAGYDPQESIRFWERMEQRAEAQPPEFLSTHPSHGNRIQQLESWMPQALQEYSEAHR